MSLQVLLDVFFFLNQNIHYYGGWLCVIVAWFVALVVLMLCVSGIIGRWRKRRSVKVETPVPTPEAYDLALATPKATPKSLLEVLSEMERPLIRGGAADDSGILSFSACFVFESEMLLGNKQAEDRWCEILVVNDENWTPDEHEVPANTVVLVTNSAREFQRIDQRSTAKLDAGFKRLLLNCIRDGKVSAIAAGDYAEAPRV